MSIVSIMQIAGASDLSGEWTVEFARDSGQSVDTEICRIEHVAEKITGHCSTDVRTNYLSGSVDGDKVTWLLKSGRAEQITATFVATHKDGNSMRGTWEFNDSSNGATGVGTFEARKR